MSINAVIVSYSMVYLVECDGGGGGGRVEKLDRSSSTANAVRHARTVQTLEHGLTLVNFDGTTANSNTSWGVSLCGGCWCISPSAFIESPQIKRTSVFERVRGFREWRQDDSNSSWMDEYSSCQFLS